MLPPRSVATLLAGITISHGLRTENLVLTLSMPWAASLGAGAEPLRAAAAIASQWAAEGAAHAPALMLGLVPVVALPLVALCAQLLIALAAGDARDASVREPAGAAACRGFDAEDRAAAVPAAWLELDDGGRCPLRAEMVRIGREEDNDIRLPQHSVERYHAAIHRADDDGFYVRDLATANGRGVVVNGKPAASARLRSGDTVALGEARLTFVLRSD
jgi:hypothetical protein